MNDAVNCLINPRSIAIIGASPDIRKLNGRPLHYLVRDGYKGHLYPINPKYKDINGLPCYPGVDTLPEAPDLGIVAVAAKRVAEAVASLGRAGTKTALIYSSGFSETGEEGKALEQTVLDTAAEHGVRICGPNNLGFINAFEGATATFSQYAQEPPIPGPIAFASQSGAFGTGISALARKRGLGFGYFVNTGNQADITLFESLDKIADDDRILVLSAYVEGLRDGREVIALADKAYARGKPLVLTKVGRKASGARAAASHTGSLAGEDTVFDGVLRQHGVIRARNEEHMLDLIGALSCCDAADGSGVAIITQSGGAGVMMADRAEEVGLNVPVLQAETQDKLRAVLPSFGGASNPVDVTGQFIAEPALLRDSVRIVMEDPNIHVCTIWLQLMEEHADMLVELFKEINAAATKPMIVCWLGAPLEAQLALQTSGVCVVAATERTIDAAAGLVELGAYRRRVTPRPTLTDVLRETGDTRPLPSMAAADLLRDAGIALPGCELAENGAQAARIASEVGFPVVIKIESPDILHKTELGGVALNLKSADAVAQATDAMIASVRAQMPEARIDGVLVAEMAKPGAEIVLGVRRDPGFGPVIMAGLGGVLIEVLKDVVFAAAPVSASDAGAMLDRLHGRAVLQGARGAEVVNREALIDTICRLSDFAIAHPELAELDLNPVFGTAEGITAVDWLMMVDA